MKNCPKCQNQPTPSNTPDISFECCGLKSQADMGFFKAIENWNDLVRRFNCGHNAHDIFGRCFGCGMVRKGA